MRRASSTRPSLTIRKSSGGDPDDADAYSRRGWAWLQKGEPDQAIADYSAAIRLFPEDAENWSDRGRAWQKKGELDKAIADLDQAIRLDPEDAENWSARGWPG